MVCATGGVGFGSVTAGPVGTAGKGGAAAAGGSDAAMGGGRGGGGITSVARNARTVTMTPTATTAPAPSAHRCHRFLCTGVCGGRSLLVMVLPAAGLCALPA